MQTLLEAGISESRLALKQARLGCDIPRSAKTAMARSADQTADSLLVHRKC